MIDIQRQLKGLPLVDEETAKTAAYVFAERVRVIHTLFAFTTSSQEEDCKRRVKAINAMTALCGLREGHHFRRRKHFSADAKLEQDLTPPSVFQVPSLSDSIPIECKPTQCIFCLGCVGLPAATRLKSFHSHGDLHPECTAVTLDSMMHSNNYAATVHGIYMSDEV